MKKINIAFMIFSDGMGGAEQVVLQLINNIDQTKYNVFLVTNNEMIKHFDRYIKNENLCNIGSLYKMSDHLILNKLTNKFISLFNLKKSILKFKVPIIEKFLLKNNINILHSHLMFDLYTAYVLKNRDNNLRLIYTLHGFLNLDKSIKLKYAISHQEFLTYLKNVDCITSVSKLLEEKLIEVLPQLAERSLFIPNGLDRSVISYVKSSIIKNKSEHVELLFMGGEKEVKGGLILLQSIEVLIRDLNVTNFTLTILGPVNFNGEFYLHIVNNEILSNYVKVIGFVNSPKHLEYIRKSDILVMPSLSEGMPIVLLEAIALQTCVVASSIPIFKTLIKNGESGILSDLDPGILAESLKNTIKNSQLRDEIIKNNQNYVIPYWDDIIKKYEKIYVENSK